MKAEENIADPALPLHPRADATYIGCLDERPTTLQEQSAGDDDVNQILARARTSTHDDSDGVKLPPLAETLPRRPRRAPTECGDMPFLIQRDGTWLYRGSPIGRKELVCFFASVLKRADDGMFWLETPVERGRIQVEDAPFTAVELDWRGCGRDQRLTFRTNIDQLVTADAEHPIRVAHDLLTCRPTPYLRVREGAGHWPIEARISRAVYYELVALAEPGQVHGRDVLGVWSSGCFFPLGETEVD